MAETATQKIEALGMHAIDVLKAAMTKGDFTKGDIIRIKAAQTSLGSWTRFRATESAERTNLLVLARELAENKQQFQDFMRVAMPNAPIMKALTNGEQRKSNLAEPSVA